MTTATHETTYRVDGRMIVAAVTAEGYKVAS
jgi:hypothetical protein